MWFPVRGTSRHQVSPFKMARHQPQRSPSSGTVRCEAYASRAGGNEEYKSLVNFCLYWCTDSIWCGSGKSTCIPRKAATKIPSFKSSATHTANRCDQHCFMHSSVVCVMLNADYILKFVVCCIVSCLCTSHIVGSKYGKTVVTAVLARDDTRIALFTIVLVQGQAFCRSGVCSEAEINSVRAEHSLLSAKASLQDACGQLVRVCIHRSQHRR